MARVTKKSENSLTIEISPIDLKTATFTIEGVTPLICNRWSEKAKMQMLKPQITKDKIKTKERLVKRPHEDGINSLYWITGKPIITDEMTDEDCAAAFYEAVNNGATFGFPAVAVKKAIVAAAYRNGLSKDKVSLYGYFAIGNELVEIVGHPEIREDTVTVGNGAADIHFRGEFKQWESTFSVTYNANILTLEKFANMLELGGFSCGIGEWRIEKSGIYGQFRIKRTDESH
jgi:hypothetical protein